MLDVDVTDVVTVKSITVATSDNASGAPNDAALLGMLTLDPLVDGEIIDGTETTGSVGWSFNSGLDQFDYLAVGEQLTITYTVTVTDDNGAEDTQTITLVIEGTNDAPTLMPVVGDTDIFLVDHIAAADRVYLNDGSGQFTDSGQILGGTLNGSNIAVGDLNGDGYNDVVVTNAGGQATQVFINTGSGDFLLGQSLAAEDARGVALGDLDGDGDIDAIVTSSSAGPNRVFLNDSSGNFVETATPFAYGSDSRSVALGDIDGDGDLDAAIGNASNQPNQVFLNDGSGVFTDSGQSIGGNVYTGDVDLGDLDGDGDLDLFVANGNNEPDQVFFNDGNGLFVDSGQALGTAQSEKAVLADLDNDGDLDAFVSSQSGESAYVYLNDGSGVFTSTGQAIGAGDSRGLALGDVDGDGDIDAAVAYISGGTKIYLNNGNASFTLSPEVLPSAATVALADLDGDGEPAAGVSEIVDLAPSENATLLVETGAFSFGDVDLTDVHTVEIELVSATDSVNGDVPERGLMTAAVATDSTGTGIGQVSWSFEVQDAAIDDLAEGQTITQVYSVSVDDGEGGSVERTVTVTITGTNDAPVALSDTGLGDPGVASLPSGLIAQWSADGTTEDAAGDNDGVLQNGASFAAGKFGQAFSFDGIDDSFSAPSTGLPTGNSDRTLSLWMKADAFGSGESFLAGYGNFGSGGQTYALGTSGDTLFFSQWGNAVFGPSLEAGQWYHVAVTNVGNSVTLYLDGVAVATGTMSINTPAGTDFLAGARPQISIPGLLQGEVDDIQVYDRALTAEEIQSIHHNVLDNDTDVDSGDSLSVVGVAAGTPPGDVSGQVGSPVAGVYGALTLGADGTWTYARDDGDPDTQQLGEGEAATDVFTYTTADAQGATSTTSLSIALHGINDMPVVTGAEWVPDDPDNLSAMISIAFADADLTDTNYNVRVIDVHVDDPEGLLSDGLDLEGLVTGIAEKASGETSGTATLTFTADETDFDLVDGQQVTLLYTVSIEDGANGVALQNFVVTISGTGSGPVVSDVTILDDVSVGAFQSIVTGTPGDDTYDNGVTQLEGTSGADLIVGLAGADELIGNGGDDWLFGGRGHDYLEGGEGDDTLNGGQGDDWLVGGKGDDTYVGGDGFEEYDAISFRGETGTSGVYANLATGVVTDTYGNSESATGIEEVDGSANDDTLIGNEAHNFFRGHGGSDTYDGGAGDYDQVAFDEEAGGFQGAEVDLALGSGTDTYGNAETFTSIEVLRGSQWIDTFTGDDGVNEFYGLAGADVLDGGDGDDTVRYDRDADFGGVDGVTVDLAAGTAIDGFGDEDALSNIENVRGTDSIDELTGDDNDNELFGLGGNDTLSGADGNDYLEGGAGNDELIGGSGDDYLVGGEGDDTYHGGGTGPDQFDVVSFRDETGGSGVVVDLAAGTATDTYGNEETLIDIEEVDGSQNDDTIVGNDADNFFRGFDGADSYDGGVGFDQVAYDAETGDNGVVIDLSVLDVDGFATGTDTYGKVEKFKSIEMLRGSENADAFIGDDGDNIFRGMAGDDVMDGGDGWDTVRYDRDVNRGGTSGVTVSLLAGTATDGFGDSDTLFNFERVVGTETDDWLIGDNLDNELIGLGGADSLDGFSGNDYLEGGAGDDILDGGQGDDYLAGGEGDDTYIGGDGPDQYDAISFRDETGAFGVVVDLGAGTATDTYDNVTIESVTGIEEVDGSKNSDMLIGNADDNFFRGFDGSDSYSGGAGDFDQVSFDDGGGSQGAIINLALGTGTDTYGNAETFTGIEVLRGSQWADTFIGDANDNTFRGMAGDDTLNGAGGNDTVRYDRDVNRGGTAEVTVDLAAGTATDGFGDSDTLIDIEHARGTQFADTLSGDGDYNQLFGLDGDDTLFGDAGDDQLFGGDGSDDLTGGFGSDEFILYAGESGVDDILDFEIGNDLISLYGYDESTTVISLADNGLGGSNLMVDGLAVASLADVSFETDLVIDYTDHHVLTMMATV
ncbi:FG-GAP-like repeat-containing protein [Mesorhizobium sp. KR9-304]|uniref:FG-GAP-like repeat-containing protein n=1 Tax=Mesorhizobium sp. KR9-304 TaxID=3156614 RepID=UPI0032B5FCBB